MIYSEIKAAIPKDVAKFWKRYGIYNYIIHKLYRLDRYTLAQMLNPVWIELNRPRIMEMYFNKIRFLNLRTYGKIRYFSEVKLLEFWHKNDYSR